MFAFDDDDEAPPVTLDPARPHVFLHGVWRDEVRGSTMYIDGRDNRLRTVYCSGGDHEATGDYWGWDVHRGQLFARFRWLSEPIDGIVVLQVESQDSMVGGWWYDQDVPPEQHARLPFVPGVNPCRWIRQDPRRPWPGWAVRGLHLPTTGSVTSESLAAPPPATRRTIVEYSTSVARYHQRVDRWTSERAGLARLAAMLRHRSWWLLHNLVAHPLLALVQGRRAVALHDWTSRGLNRDDSIAPSSPPHIEQRLWWIVHNLVAHPAIALVPCEATFRWHDATARKMRVAGWL